MQSLVSHAKKEKHKWIQDLCLKSDLCFRKVTPVPGQVWGGGGWWPEWQWQLLWGSKVTEPALQWCHCQPGDALGSCCCEHLRTTLSLALHSTAGSQRRNSPSQNSWDHDNEGEFITVSRVAPQQWEAGVEPVWKRSWLWVRPWGAWAWTPEVTGTLGGKEVSPALSSPNPSPLCSSKGWHGAWREVTK